MKQSRVVSAYGKAEINLWENESLETESAMALDFITRWGMVAAVPDGEDSSGRQQLRLATTDELVERAFEAAAKAMSKARSDGLIHTTPDLPMNDDKQK